MRLPIGHSDFGKIILAKRDLVDKSLFIHEVVEDDAEVILITRPRRFGKTLNLSMLRYFFSQTVKGHPTRLLFDHFNISKKTAFCIEHQGRYPVIFLSFKDMKSSVFDDIYLGLCAAIREVYAEHDYLLLSDKIADRDKVFCEKILNQDICISDMMIALKYLTKYLYLHHGTDAIILLDEYDTPIQSSYLGDEYDKIVNFFRNFFSSALKDNDYLFKAIMTGILRVSKESFFSRLNNISIYSILKEKYSSYFGFTESEVIHLLKAVNMHNEAEMVKAWYNGYQIGNNIIYNPWSIVNCIRDHAFQPYWVNTSDNALIKDILLHSDSVLRDELECLFKNQSIETIVDECFVYSDLKHADRSAVWSFLLMAGYLKIVSSQETADGVYCKLAIPNMEIRSLYKKMIKQWLSHGRNVVWYDQFLDYLLVGDMVKFSEGLTDIMQETVSVHDVAVAPEAFYHGLIIGLTASLYSHPDYEIRSNRESGHGRYDYLIIARRSENISILLEIKRADTPMMLSDVATRALQQIERQDYIAEIRQRDIHNLLIIGIAFSGKKFEIAHRIMML